MLNWRTLLFGLVFGSIDSIALPIVKGISAGWSMKWMVIPFALYALSPFVFLKALAGESLTIMNLVWDLSSDVIVTIIGIFLFAEQIPPVKMVGLVFSFISLFLMTYEGNGWNEFLLTNYQKLTGG